jgi:hypothetical protein
MRHTLFIVLLTCFVVIGCSTPPSKPYVPPADKPLQDPLPGQALIYLLRAPYDPSQLEVSLSDKVIAILPQSTYTAVSLPPGDYVLQTKSSAMFASGVPAAEPFKFVVKPNERRFFNISGATAMSPGVVAVLPVRGGGVVPLVLRHLGTEPAGRSWKEVTELDAQGLMSIARLVLPERNAF